MTRTLFSMLGLALPGLSLAAEPILLPDFTAGTPDEFAVTVMLQEQVSERLLQDGHIVLTNAVVAPVVGPEAVTNCAAAPSCPSEILPKLPTRLAIVVRVNRMGGTLVGHFELFEQSNPNPFVVRDVPIAPGNEHMFAHEVSAATAQMIAQVGPSPDAVLMAAARLIAGQSPSAAPPPAPAPAPMPTPMPAPMPAPVPVPVATSVPVPVPVPVPRAGTPQVMDLDGPAGAAAARGRIDPNATTGELLEGTGVHYRHLLGSEQHFRNSGLDPRDWVYKAMPHAGRFTFEVRAGLGLGDVDRQADMRVSLLGNQQQDAWFQEAPKGGRRPRGGIFVGYAPATMIDLGVVAGLQYGKRFFTTGYARVDKQDGSVTEEVDQSHLSEPVDAVQFYLQPRVRAYLVPTGPAKPFVFTGADVRIFDAYHLEQNEQYVFALPPAGSIPGWIGGAGMMIDPSPIVGFFFEGNYTQHFGARATTFTSGLWEHKIPQLSESTSYTIGLIGGAQFRI